MEEDGDALLEEALQRADVVLQSCTATRGHAPDAINNTLRTDVGNLSRVLASLTSAGACISLPANKDEAPDAQLAASATITKAVELFKGGQQLAILSDAGSAPGRQQQSTPHQRAHTKELPEHTGVAMTDKAMAGLALDAAAKEQPPRDDTRASSLSHLALEIMQCACDLHCLVALDEAGEVAAAEVALIRLQMCNGLARAHVHPMRAEECLALCRPSIEPILAYVSATRALPPNIAGAVDTAVLEDFVAEAHDTVALHAMMLWKLGNYAGALSTATECVALLQEHAVPVGPSIGRALCVDLAGMLVDLGRPAVQSASSVAAGFTPAPGASVGASSGKPPSLPVLHAARQMLELAHEVVECGEGCHVKCVQLYEQGHSQGLAHGQAQDPCAKGGSGLARQNEDTQKEAGQQQLQLGGEGEKQILQVLENAKAPELMAGLREQVLIWLALCHLALGTAVPTLRCLDVLQQAYPNYARDPAFVRVRLEALLLAARHQEAHAVFMENMSLEDASPGTCIEMFQMVMLSPRALQNLQEARAVLMELMSLEDASPVSCMEALQVFMLSPHAPLAAAATTATNATAGAAAVSMATSVSADREGVAFTANTDKAQQRRQQQQDSMAAALLPAFWVLLERVPELRGELTVRLLLKAAQAHNAGAPSISRLTVDALVTSLLLPSSTPPQAPTDRQVTHTNPGRPSGGSDLGSSGSPCGHLAERRGEGLVQHLLEFEDLAREGGPGQGGASAGVVRRACRELVWACGKHHFDAQDFEATIPFFQASLMYTSEPVHAIDARESLALCCLAMNLTQEAWEHLEHVERMVQLRGKQGPEAQPDGKDLPVLQLPVTIPFLKLKICLLQQNAGAALEQLRRMPSCAEYSPAILEVVCHEAVHAGIHSVACDALSLLHEAVAKGEVENMCEADVLRVHIRCYEIAGEQKAKAAQAGAQTPPKLSFQHYDNLARLCNTVRNRLDAIGFLAFFGESREEGTLGGQEPQPQQHRLESSMRPQAALEWFAETAWRAAVAARRAEVPQACAVLLAACANMLAHHPHPQLRHLRLQRLAFVSAAASVLDVHMKNPAVATALDLAKSLLRNSKSMATRIQEFGNETPPSGPALIPGHVTLQTSDQQVERLIVHLEMVLAVRSVDQHELRHLLFEDLPNRVPEERPSAQEMVYVAMMMMDTGDLQQETGYHLACYQLALQQLAVERDPDLGLVPKVLRKLVEFSPGDNGRLASFREASQILGQLASQSVARGTGQDGRLSGGGFGARSGQSTQKHATNREGEEMVIAAGDDAEGSFGDDAEGSSRGEGGEGQQGEGKTGPGMVKGALGRGNGSDRGEDNASRAAGQTKGETQLARSVAAWKRTCFAGEDVEWMVSTCWNRGAFLSRLLRPAEALQFMRAALALLNFMPASYDKTYRAMMEDQLQKAVTASTLPQDPASA